jgi:tetratricopeptide (TPR) repeat protein
MYQAQRALQANQPDAAARAYQAVLKLDPENIEARANLGVVAMSTGDWKKAAENLQAALKLQPAQSKVQALLGLCEMNLGSSGEGQRLLSAAFPKLDDPKLKRKVGMMLLDVDFQNGEYDKASAILASLKEIDPGDPTISYAAFRVYSELAYQAIASLAINSPGSAELHSALAEHLVNDGRTAAAITEYRKALSISPDLPGLHFELGQAIIAESHLDASLVEAQHEFESSLRLNPMNARCECQLAEVELLRSNSVEASLHYAQALKIDPKASCAKAGLAAQLIDEGKEQQALEYLQAAVRGDPDNAQFHYRLGVLYRRLGNKEEAAKEMEKFKQLREMKDDLQRSLHPG